MASEVSGRRPGERAAASEFGRVSGSRRSTSAISSAERHALLRRREFRGPTERTKAIWAADLFVEERKTACSTSKIPS